VSTSEVLLASRCRRTFGNAHTYHINSISVNSDQETFLSADDLRINLWSLERSDQSFNIVDIKPTNMEDLTEVRGCGADGGIIRQLQGSGSGSRELVALMGRRAWRGLEEQLLSRAQPRCSGSCGHGSHTVCRLDAALAVPPLP
jgi:hypothetical protein